MSLLKLKDINTQNKENSYFMVLILNLKKPFVIKLKIVHTVEVTHLASSDKLISKLLSLLGNSKLVDLL